MERTRWFKDARFGMFIHWGIYSIPARGTWLMYQENVPPEEYNKLASKFNPRKYNPDEWVALAKEAGMKYMVLTTRHHDGFSLFDSKVSEFTSAKTAAGRDLVREFVEACRRRGMKIGFYYSLPDWQWPAFFKGPEKDPKGWAKYLDYVHTQVRELCTNYGKIDLLWYDTMTPRGRKSPYGPAEWQARKLNSMVRRLQPHILINDRSGLPGDYETHEQRIVKSSRRGRPWELCMTMNYHWSYFARDFLWKHPKEIIQHLTGCASGEGNYLLNVGPKPDGTIPQESVRRLREIGKWMKVSGEAIYGSERAPFESGTAGVVTARGKKCYLIVHWWPGEEICLPSVKVKIRSAYILATGEKVALERKGERLILLGLPAKPPDVLSTVIVMERAD